MFRRFLFAVPVVVALSLSAAVPALAANPPGTGLPLQSCQDLEPHTPGNAADSRARGLADEIATGPQQVLPFVFLAGSRAHKITSGWCSLGT